jgi:hypothetical protein
MSFLEVYRCFMKSHECKTLYLDGSLLECEITDLASRIIIS